MKNPSCKASWVAVPALLLFACGPVKAASAIEGSAPRIPSVCSDSDLVGPFASREVLFYEDQGDGSYTAFSCNPRSSLRCQKSDDSSGLILKCHNTPLEPNEPFVTIDLYKIENGGFEAIGAADGKIFRMPYCRY